LTPLPTIRKQKEIAGERRNNLRKVIVVSGLPGSGKSTVAEGIAEKLGIPIFSVDPIESSIIKSGIKRSFETGLAAYLVTETLVAEQLSLGIPAVIDAVSAVKEARDMWRTLSNKFNARLIIIECVLDRDLHKKRIESRVRNIHGIPEVTWNDVDNRSKEYLTWKEKRLVLDTSDNIESNLDRAFEYISAEEKES
jgi:predicted kinase